MEETKNVAPEEMLEREGNTFDFQAIYTSLILNWKWFVVSLIICVGAAAIYLRYKTPVYQAYAKLLIKNDEDSNRRGGNSLRNATNLGMISASNGIDNEMEILTSRTLAEQVVRDLKLYVTYQTSGKISQFSDRKNASFL